MSLSYFVFGTILLLGILFIVMFFKLVVIYYVKKLFGRNYETIEEDTLKGEYDNIQYMSSNEWIVGKDKRYKTNTQQIKENQFIIKVRKNE